ncbi:TPA: ead/Ea22-like family protein [Salmonella enterica subsp. enterica serovar Litchfield]|nr:ead/Ea22-like family protein [Salmonella enterica]EDN3353032.1 ead/Ea22-like family protein [Salmonella enterica subsp. enterica serovar Litchfield]EAP5014700.1 ead/Ea22-like family protein [Salmonella enterica]EAU3022595.1 ead/Ea22-like family protein [Salmonella enterica]EAW3127059.1 ead/Ea22-like family protein [Salmonella enterica]
MSNIDKQALRERYSPQPAPECHICGKEMTIQRMSARRITYGCTGATYDDKGCHYAEGRSIADDHYEQSRVTVVDVSDPDVLALLDELEHYKSREERVTKLVLDNSTSWDALYKKLEAAEKRTAELERANVAKDDHINQQQDRIEQLEKGHQEAAKQINSWRRLAKQNIAERGKDISELEAARQRIAELESKLSNPVLLPKTNGYWNEQEKAYEEAITLAKRRIRMAGFRCEGDE